jgi:AcrR family transcriptional regulator
MCSAPVASAGKRERNKARNRAEILEAAREIFVEIGYDAASIRDIVARTELAPGTFYNYFPDKRAVLLALVGEATQRGGQLIREARARGRLESFERSVVESFRAYFTFIADDPTLFELMRRNVATLRTLDMDESGFALGLLELHADLERAMSAGDIPPVPLDYLTRAIGAVAFEVGAAMVQKTPPDVAGATRFAARLILGGLEQGRLRESPPRARQLPQHERRTSRVPAPKSSASGKRSKRKARA